MTRPVFAEVGMRCQSLDLEVPPGEVIGFSDRDTAVTAEGPVLSLELSGRLYRESESDVNEWRVAGEPSLHLLNPAVDTRLTTCTQLVNRIPDLLAAPPGLLTVAELPAPRLRPGPLAGHLGELA
jgi:4-hydroxy-tetrahydrodipicolinate reductase